MGVRLTLMLSSAGFPWDRHCSVMFFSSIIVACISANRLCSDSAVPSPLETVFFTRKSQTEEDSVKMFLSVSFTSCWLSKREIEFE